MSNQTDDRDTLFMGRLGEGADYRVSVLGVCDNLYGVRYRAEIADAMNAVVAAFRQRITDWAISKKWYDPAKPRSPIQLIGLCMTEIAECEEGWAAYHDAVDQSAETLVEAALLNVDEEIAGFCVRCIQAHDEIGVQAEWDGVLLDNWWKHTNYWAACKAIESLRKKQPDVQAAWGALMTAMTVMALRECPQPYDRSPQIDLETTGDAFAASLKGYLLHVIGKEMNKNDARPEKHGKSA